MTSYQSTQFLANQLVAQSRENKTTSSSLCEKLTSLFISAVFCSFYITETILFYDDVKPAFPPSVSKATQFFLNSTAATAICGTLVWGILGISTMTSSESCTRYFLRMVSYFGLLSLSVLWFINVVVIGLWDFGHLSEVSQYAPSYFFTFYIFNIVVGILGECVFVGFIVTTSMDLS